MNENETDLKLIDTEMLFTSDFTWTLNATECYSECSRLRNPCLVTMKQILLRGCDRHGNFRSRGHFSVRFDCDSKDKADVRRDV